MRRVTPTAGDVIAFINLLEQGGNVFRIVLQVAIHRDDDGAVRFVEAGGEGRSLAEIAAEADHL